MATEIERKFLLKTDAWRDSVIQSTEFHQGYLSSNAASSVRVRIEGEQANINVKGAVIGVARPEYEYSIPLQDAQELLTNLCEQPQVQKIRHIVPCQNSSGESLTWEIDEFLGDNQGLVVAEIELTHVDQAFPQPDWLGEEVSSDIRYYNSCLAKAPYNTW